MEFSLATIIISIFVLIGIGFLIGSIGVGGVYLVPFLVYYHEIDISLAISVAMFSFMFTGISGFITYFKKINFNWNNIIFLIGGCIPGSVLGSYLLWEIPQLYLKSILAFVTIFSGFQTLIKLKTFYKLSLNRKKYLFIGMFVGLGSPLTGSGGPLIFMPTMILLGAPILISVGMSQIIQIPISLFSSISNLFYGQINFFLAMPVIILMVLGVIIGVNYSTKIKQSLVKNTTGYGLIITGIFISTMILLEN